MSKHVALLPGDGAGQEVIPEAVKVLRATGADLEFEEFEVGGSRVVRGEPAMPDDVFEAAKRADSILFGAVGDPRVPDVGYPAQVLLKLRFELDLYANLRPARLYDARLSPLKDERARQVNLLIVRENTEGIYVGMGGRFKRGTPDEVAIQEDLNTHKGVERVIEVAFEKAERQLVMVDKSNAMQHAGGLWHDVWNVARARRGHLATRHLYADAAAMELVRDPSQFDVIVTNNLFGDILSDLAAQLIGGMCVAPSANVNPQTGAGMFEPVHGSAPNIAGQGIVNPIGAILTGAMMLEHLGFTGEAQAVEAAVAAAIREGECTRDLGGSLSTSEAGDAVARRVPD